MGPVPQEFANGRVQDYRVRVWEINQWNHVELVVTTVGETTTSALISGLNLNSRYEVYLLAFTSAGDGKSTFLSLITNQEGRLLANVIDMFLFFSFTLTYFLQFSKRRNL